MSTFPTASDPFDFLAGGGEMAKLIGAMDWAATPLGPIEFWPQSLRTTVSLCLASNFPISIAWGPQHVQIYNDGYWPICGGKHPVSMGQDYTECWASAWPAIGEAFERGRAGQASYIENQRMFLDRKGFLEETFFTFSFSPIRDESGGVGGLFHPVTEQTGKILSERRVRMLRDLAARTGSARTTAEVFATAAEIFADYAFDLPFVLFYRLNEAGTHASLFENCGLAPGTEASQVECDLSGGQGFWPIAAAARQPANMRLEEVDGLLAPLACGPYPEAPQTALLLPIFIDGATTATVVLVAGVSSRLPLDQDYLGFYDMLAAGMTSCVANAYNYETASRRAEALAELDRAKTTFFSNISHEFRTPLSLILGPLDEVLKGERAGLSAMQSENLEIAQRNTLRLLKLVNALLDFSRVEANRAKAVFEPADLAAITVELVSNFRSACEAAGLRLVVDCGELPPLLYVDREMWEKITLNLISNAFKFTFFGEICVSLHRRADEQIELGVRDTGIGIPPQDLQRIFERFTRVDAAQGRTHEGSGIGLALVQDLAQLLGGSVSVESEVDRGSMFRVVLPLRVALPQASERLDEAQIAPVSPRVRAYVQEAALWLPQPQAHAPAGAAEDGDAHVAAGAQSLAAGARIVLADDNADMRRYIARILTDSGYDVQAAEDGVAALAVIRAGPMPDLVLTDVMMPRLNGFGLLREIRGDGTLCHLPVVMLSARAGEEASVDGLLAGADDYLIKPFGARELLARVQGNIGLARLRRRLVEQERFALVVDASPTALVMIGPSGLVELANRQAERMFGYEPQELLNRALEELIPPRYRGSDAGLKKNFMGDPSCRLMGVEHEVFGLRKDGGEVPLEIGLNPVSIDGREMVLVALVDVTIRQKVALDRELQRAKLEKSNSDLEAFAYIASHDLKAPLRAITHLAAWITEDIQATATPQTLAYLNTLTGRAARLQRLLDGLLSYSRIGREKAIYEIVNIADLVGDIVALTPPRPGFVVSCQPPLVALRTWHTPLRVVLDNLIGNGLKHHDRDSGAVSVSMRVENGVAEIRVSDDGPGIAPQFHERVFEIFQTLVSRDVLESSGMGLAIVRKMVEVHGGRIWIESAPPARGTSFVFTWTEAAE